MTNNCHWPGKQKPDSNRLLRNSSTTTTYDVFNNTKQMNFAVQVHGQHSCWAICFSFFFIALDFGFVAFRFYCTDRLVLFFHTLKQQIHCNLSKFHRKIILQFFAAIESRSVGGSLAVLYNLSVCNRFVFDLVEIFKVSIQSCARSCEFGVQLIIILGDIAPCFVSAHQHLNNFSEGRRMHLSAIAPHFCSNNHSVGGFVVSGDLQWFFNCTSNSSWTKILFVANSEIEVLFFLDTFESRSVMKSSYCD